MPAVARAFGDAGKQQRAARDRLEMLVGFGETDKDVPPVVDKRDHACSETAAREIPKRTGLRLATTRARSQWLIWQKIVVLRTRKEAGRANDRP